MSGMDINTVSDTLPNTNLIESIIHIINQIRLILPIDKAILELAIFTIIFWHISLLFHGALAGYVRGEGAEGEEGRSGQGPAGPYCTRRQ